MIKTTDLQDIKIGDYCYTKEGTQAVLVDYAVMSGVSKYMINLFYEGEVFYAEYHQCYDAELDVPYEIEDKDRPILVESIFKNPPIEKVCKEIKDKNIEIQNKKSELSLVNKDYKTSLERLNALKKLCINMYNNIEGMKQDYFKYKEDYIRISCKIESAKDTLYDLNNNIESKQDYYNKLSNAVLQFKMGNKDLEKIPESSEVIKLRERDKILSALEAGGVDNWQWYSESLKNAGL